MGTWVNRVCKSCRKEFWGSKPDLGDIFCDNCSVLKFSRPNLYSVGEKIVFLLILWVILIGMVATTYRACSITRDIRWREIPGKHLNFIDRPLPVGNGKRG